MLCGSGSELCVMQNKIPCRDQLLLRLCLALALRLLRKRRELSSPPPSVTTKLLLLWASSPRLSRSTQHV